MRRAFVLTAHPALAFSISVERPLPSDEITGHVELSAAELQRWRTELAAATLELIDRN